MITRKSAMAIAEAYYQKYTYYSSSSPLSRSKVYKEPLYDFLYINEFDSWLLNAIKSLHSKDTRNLKDFFLQIHTGESLTNATPRWDWEQRKELGQRILKELSEVLITERLTNPEFELYGDTTTKAVDSMIRHLEIDGYIYHNGVLLLPEASVVDEEEEETLLITLFKEITLEDKKILQHHLDLSGSHYNEERWDDSIANSRKVLEFVLKSAAIRYSALDSSQSKKMDFDRPVRVRDYLEKESILEQKEKNAIAQIYGLLSNTGGHPYIAQKDQARLLRHYSLTTCQFVLLRLRGAIQNKSS